jgi:2-polyprenyl-3-methyl-5-hydroxy-6-metoxy-1,4-benzoquinol methylase
VTKKAKMKSEETSPDAPVETCPWWICFTFENPLRRLLHNPAKMLSPYVKKGWMVMDIGPGMGYFTIPLARLVGEEGRVIAVDIEQHMLDGVRNSAKRAGVEKRIELQLSQPGNIGVSGPLDFTLAFWMVHEVRDRAKFVSQIASATRPGGLLFFVEPKIHVARENFDDTVAKAGAAGFEVIEHPKVTISYAALLRKKAQV